MFEEKITKPIDHFLNEEMKEEINKLLEDHYTVELAETRDINSPYITGVIVTKLLKYNPDFGDDKICECGDSYYRHFDSYEDMEPVGCKYCPCNYFVEKTEEQS